MLSAVILYSGEHIKLIFPLKTQICLVFSMNIYMMIPRLQVKCKYSRFTLSWTSTTLYNYFIINASNLKFGIIAQQKSVLIFESLGTLEGSEWVLPLEVKGVAMMNHCITLVNIICISLLFDCFYYIN